MMDNTIKREKFSIQENLPKGLFFYYLKHSRGHHTVAITREPIVTHADEEDNYDTVKLTDSFVGLMTLNAIIAHLRVIKKLQGLMMLGFHPLSEVEFFIIEIENMH